MTSKIVFLYIDAGGGHRAAANALRDVIAQQGRDWDIELVCIQKLLDSIDFIHKYTGIQFQDVYNIMLRKGWTFGSAQLIPIMHLLIRMSHDRQVEVLQKYWRESRPDLVVSLVPHYNRSLQESLDIARPGVPYVTILTDITDYPPHFWIEQMEQHVICGSARAADQARELGLREDQILQASGMILNPAFYSRRETDRAAGLERLGLRPDVPTGLVLFGGEGSMRIVEVARALNHGDRGLQLILICGKHEEAARTLREMPHEIPMHIEGFTREIPHYMSIADFFIGKPGPGSISEAIARKLPVILLSNALTMAHERGNAEWVEREGLGIVVRRIADIPGAVERMIAPESYARFRQRAAATQNFAVFEIPGFLDRILHENGASTAAA